MLVTLRREVLKQKVKSPCIGVCSTGIGDSICRGCKRFSHEIIHWNGYTEAQRESIDLRLQSLLAQVMKAYVVVHNENLLKEQMNFQNIPHNPLADRYCWVFDLLKAGASQIDNLADYGCSVLAPYTDMSLLALRDAVDKDYYVLSSVHYERYFR